MPKTTIVRVTREYSCAVEEHVDIDVVQDDDAGSYPGPASIAESLVNALMAAGHDVDWNEVSEKVKPHTTYITSEVLNPEPPEPMIEPSLPSNSGQPE